MPSFWAAKIYLSGIRSRQAATELSLVFKEELAINNLNEISEIIIRNKEKLKGRSDCSENTLHWIEILSKEKTSSKKSLPKITGFTFSEEDVKIASPILYCKSYNGSCFLCSPDYKDKIEVIINDDFPFDKVCDIPGIYFEWVDDRWEIRNKNPHFQLSQ